MAKQREGRDSRSDRATAASRRVASAPLLRPTARQRRETFAAALSRVSRIIDQIALPRAPQEFRISVRRPDDLVVVDLIFEGLAFKPDPPRLERSAADAIIVAELPPQSFGEEAFFEVASQEEFNPVSGEKIEVTSHPGYPPKNVAGGTEHVPAALPAARIRMAGRSRIVVAMPAGIASIPYDLSSMLAALREWPMRLDVNAIEDPPTIRGESGWLVDVVETPIWRAMKTGIEGALVEIGRGARAGRTLLQAIDAAAARLATRAAGGLSADVPDDLSGALQQTMLAEMTSLERQFSALGKEQGRAVAVTALSLAATEALARQVRRFGSDAAILANVPFLPIIFGPHEPSHSVTALELPYRLILSPIGSARWRHRDVPVARGSRTELWHTRLGTGAHDIGADSPSRIRALWSPDYRPQEQMDELIAVITQHPRPPEGPAPNPDLIRMSLDPVDRSMLVTLMAGFDAERDGGRTYQPLSSEAKRLHLSALGALLDSEGNWTILPKDIDLQQWRHLATLGRDHYVQVMYEGYLCPFGHPASLVKVTERKFQSLGDNMTHRVALLRQRFFIVVREPVRLYDGGNHLHHGHNFPFNRIEILTRVTPDLSEPGMGASGLAGIVYDTITPRMLFWPMVPANNTDKMVDFPFEIAGTHIGGNRITFSMPLLFVGRLADEKKSADLKAAYNASPAGTKRQVFLGGAVIAYAPFGAVDKGDPRLPTSDMTFKAGDLSMIAVPNFYPEVERATVGIKSIQKLLAQPNFVAEVAYPDIYMDSAFDPAANPGQVFLQLTSSLPLTFGGSPGQAKSDALGALASPQMNLLGLSKTTGPVAGKPATNMGAVKTGLQKAVGGIFDPKEFFDGATILGGIELSEILKLVPSLAGADVPKMLAQDFPDRVEASFDWATDVSQPDGKKLLIPRADPGKPPTRLAMNGRVVTPHDPALPPTFEAIATISNFKVNLFGFIILWFEQLTFAARSGQKPDVTVELRQGDEAVQFGGPLEFVNELRRFIPSNGFSDPPGLSVTPSGISASYSLNLPAIQVGLFALSNASLGAAFNLPFDAKPASVKFNFAERQQPFNLTVSLLGGGGFFAIGVSARGVNEIEAALEFGAAIAIDLGVASGGVEIKAGIYFHWLEPIPDQGSVTLEGYVRIHGELSVLAIISVSLTFHLSLGYQKAGGQSIVYGEAELVVEIEILVFSASVSVRCRREFQGGASDPKFIDLIPTAAVWNDYCRAFAEEAA
jgi:hypothetical protein